MPRYADPRRCPDCGGPIAPGDASCGRCALPLRGETAARLFATLSLADDLLAALRSGPVTMTPYPTTATAKRPRRRVRLRAASVPAVLLSLGAGCLLVAALVFLAVAWSALGVGGRTATLVGLTVLAGGIAWWLGRRGLRAAAESLALVGYGLLVLDVVGADHAGWLGDPSTSGLLGVVGAVLAVSGAAGALLVRRATPLSSLATGELAAAAGVGLGVVALASNGQPSLAPALVLAVLLAAAGVVLARLLRLRAATVGAIVVMVTAWLALTDYALVRVNEHNATWHALWAQFDAWPLIVAAALAAAVSLLRPLAHAARVGGLAVAQPLLCWAALAPVTQVSVTAVTLVAVGVLAAAGVATWLLPRRWALSSALTQATAGLVALVAAAGMGVVCLVRVAEAIDPVWGGHAGDRLPVLPSGTAIPEPWLLPVLLLALAGTAVTLARASETVRHLLVRAAEPVQLASVLAGSLVLTLALYPAPMWLVLAALAALAAAGLGWWRAGGPTVALASAAGFLAAAVALSLHAPGLSAAVALAVVAAAGVVALRARGELLAAAGGAVLTAAAAGSAWGWGEVVAARPVDTVLGTLLALGGLVLAAPYAPGRWWACARPVVARTGTEAGAALAAAMLAGTGVLLAPVGSQLAWTSLYLTVGGVAASATALLRADRRQVGWAGGLLLAGATWARLWEQGVQLPEAYTLPGALALLVVGVVRLRRRHAEGTVRALGPGLGLALTPSLLWALREPAGLRELLLGAGCLLLVLAGARLRWTAPIVAGAAVGAVLVLWLAAPDLGQAVPRWVLIGLAGTVLVAVGATWERRLQEARQLVGYMRALR